MSSIVYSLSDHDPQFLTVNNTTAKVNLTPLKQRTRKLNNEIIAQFLDLLENKTWKPVFKNRTQIVSLTLFYICIFLNIFEASFPVQNKIVGRIKKDWVTQVIKMSCKHKRSLYIYIAGTVIIYSRLRVKLDNQIKTTWNIIKY
jgi:hypothetical protein